MTQKEKKGEDVDLIDMGEGYLLCANCGTLLHKPGDENEGCLTERVANYRDHMKRLAKTNVVLRRMRKELNKYDNSSVK
jgi:hypothetical protein